MSGPDPRALRLYRAACALLPGGFRERYGAAMEAMLRDEWATRRGFGRWALVARAAADVIWTAVAVRIAPGSRAPGTEGKTMRWAGLGMDLKTSLRALRRAPLFTSTAALSLALGFGGVATVYALADRLLLHPIQGVRDPQELVEITPAALPYPVVEDFAEGVHTLEGIAAHRMRTVALDIGGKTEARPVRAGIVTGNYFDLLGIAPVRGRTLTPADNVRGAPPVVVLSHALWTEMGARDDVVGTDIAVNGSSFRVVGVAPERFSGLRLALAPAFWMTVESWPTVSLGRTPDVQERNWGWIAAVGRRAPGATLASVTDEVRAVAARIGAAHPENAVDLERVGVAPARLAAADQAGPVLGSLLMALAGIVALALLAAAANVANLLLARATRRSRELAVRAALGADRLRLARLAVIETGVLVLLGAALGAGLSATALRALASIRFPGGIRIAGAGLHPDARLAVLACLLLLLVATVAGLAPTLTASRISAGAAGSDRSGGAGPRGFRTRAALAGAQVAAGVVLLAGTLLFGVSIARALRVDLGFDPSRMAVVGVDASLYRDDLTSATAALTALVRRIRDESGVQAASWSSVPPLVRGYDQESFEIVGKAWPGNPPIVEVNAVGGDFFAAAGIPLVAGDASATSAPVVVPRVVVNEAMARRYWPGDSPVGAQVVLIGHPFQVVAVAADTRFHGFDAESQPTAFGILPALPSPSVAIVLRGPGAQAVLRSVRGLARSVDPRLVIVDASSGPAMVDSLLAPQRIGGGVALLFAVLAVALCLTGVYGVVAYGVSARLREFGVRLTLGAAPRRIAGEVLRRSLAPLAGGALLGVTASLALTRVAAAFLFGVRRGDPLPAALATVAVVVMALLATWIPARRAGRVDPASVLAAE